VGFEIVLIILLFMNLFCCLCMFLVVYGFHRTIRVVSALF
jgi:hypothetical protein